MFRWTRTAALLVLGLVSTTSARPAGPPGPDADRARLHALQAAGPWTAVESLATSMLTRLESSRGADSLAIAEACYAIAEARNDRNLPDDTLTLRCALRALGIRRRHLPPDHEDVAQSESMVGVAFMTSGSADSAVGHFRNALDQRRGRHVPPDTTLADVLYNFGSAQTALGHGREALEALQSSLEIETRLHGHDSRDVANGLLAVGDAWDALREYDRAREVEEQGLQILDRLKLQNDRLRGGLLSRLSEIYMDLGDMSRAFDTAQLDEARAAAGVDTSDIITSRFNVGIMLRQFGDNAGARRVLADLLPLAIQFYGPTHALTGRLHEVLGSACAATGDTALAMRMYQAGEAALQASREPMGSTLALVVEYQADLLFKQKRFAEARAMNARAIALSEAAVRADPGVVPYTRYLRLQILERMRDTLALDSARRELADVRDRLGMRNTRVGPAIAHWLAHTDRVLGRRDQAWAEALEAEALGRRQTRVSLETLADSRALQLSAERSYILSQVLDMADTEDRFETAWDRLVRTRGMVRAQIARRRLPPALLGDSALVAAHDAWASTRQALARRAVRGAVGDSAARAELAAVRLAADRAESDYAKALHARGTDTTRVDVGLDDVRAQLAPGQALVACAEIQGRDEKDRVIAFVARGGGTRIERIELGHSDTLRTLIEPWRERLATSPGPGSGPGAAAELECRRAGLGVRQRIWDRIAAHLAGITEVHLIGDGPLVDLPWHALPSGSSGYLIERSPRIHVLEAERELIPPPPVHAGTALLALGDPDFGRAGAPRDAGVVVASVRAAPDPCAGGAPHFPRLPGTGAEAAAVAEVWRDESKQSATVLTGADATEAAFKRLAPGSGVIHLATHGVVLGDQCRDEPAGTRGIGGVAVVASSSRAPEHASAAASPPPPSPWMGRRVWLALAGADRARDANDDADDGLLTADEVVTLGLAGTEWVVLSACHSGLAESWSKEGTLGMSRAFQLAGARSVIASQWAIADDATVEWMRTLYQVRAAGETRASRALETTCRRVLDARRRSGRSTHPFYWAAFGARGD